MELTTDSSCCYAPSAKPGVLPVVEKRVEQTALYPPSKLGRGLSTRTEATLKKLHIEFPVGRKLAHATIAGEPFRRKVGEKSIQWFLPCRCDCGTQFEDSVSHLRDRSSSCGCQKQKRIRNLNLTHGFSNDPILKHLLSTFQGMAKRAGSSERYEHAMLCEEWKRPGERFLLWALENGWEPGMSVDRIDNALGYSPENCRIVTDVENANNRSSSVIVDYYGEKRTLAQLCRVLNKDYRTVQQRMRRYGYPLERALKGTDVPPDLGPCVFAAVSEDGTTFAIGRTACFRETCSTLRRKGFSEPIVHRPTDKTCHGFIRQLAINALDDLGFARFGRGEKKGNSRGWIAFGDSERFQREIDFDSFMLELERRVPAERVKLLEKARELRSNWDTSVK